MAKRHMTIEDVAGMVKRGFDQTSTKQDLHEFRKEVNDRFNTVEDDIRDIKIALGPLVRVVAALESDVRSLHARVSRLERKTGLAR